MFPIGAWEFAPTLGWETPLFASLSASFSQFSGIGTLLDWKCSSTGNQTSRSKRRLKMSSQSQFTRTLVAIVAAVVMSTVAVGAAVGPAQAVANPIQVSTNA